VRPTTRKDIHRPHTKLPFPLLSFHPDTTVDVTDDYTIRFNFPEPDSLALAKFRGFHIPSERFWDEGGGFGYRKLGTSEGHW
jgi:ABC-type transport system substrate-binding protein